MKKNYTLYNMIFPFWMFFIFPPLWLIVLPLNRIIDTLVLLYAAKKAKIPQIKALYQKTIRKVWIWGFFADIIGALFLFLCFPLESLLGSEVIVAINYDPWSHPLAFLWTFVALVLSGIAIFLLNYHRSFAKTSLSPEQKKTLALSLAIDTAPYLFFLPLALFY